MLQLSWACHLLRIHTWLWYCLVMNASVIFYDFKIQNFRHHVTLLLVLRSLQSYYLQPKGASLLHVWSASKIALECHTGASGSNILSEGCDQWCPSFLSNNQPSLCVVHPIWHGSLEGLLAVYSHPKKQFPGGFPGILTLDITVQWVAFEPSTIGLFISSKGHAVMTCGQSSYNLSAAVCLEWWM